MIAAMPVSTAGDLTQVMASPDDHIAALNVDLPFYLPIEDGRPYDVMLSDRPVLIFHERRERGAEEFSTLDTTELPYFSRLQIQMRPFTDFPVGPRPVDENFTQRLKSYLIIIEVLEKLDEFLKINSNIRLLKGAPPKLTYRIGYFRRGEPPTQVAESVYMTSDPVRIRGPESGIVVDNEALRSFLSESLKIDAFARQVIEPTFRGRSFRDRVLITLNDFCYYCRQHPQAIAQLEEEQIRDLFLVVVKCLFGGGEGEVFHFDGKLDYKIINPDNKYEFVTGELKWWRGPASAGEIYHQGVRKHATGQEAEIYLVMLNSNKDIRAMAGDYWKSIEAEPETKAQSRFSPSLPTGSRERFEGFVVEIRGESIPLIAAIADLFYERT